MFGRVIDPYHTCGRVAKCASASLSLPRSARRKLLADTTLLKILDWEPKSPQWKRQVGGRATHLRVCEASRILDAPMVPMVVAVASTSTSVVVSTITPIEPKKQ